MLYFITYPEYEGHWHKWYNYAVCSELDRYNIPYKKIITDYTSENIKDVLDGIQKIPSHRKDKWLFSMAQNPAIELVEHKPGKKFGHINGLGCFPFEPAVMQGIDLQDEKFFGYYEGLFLSSLWSYKNAIQNYPQYTDNFFITGFPIDFNVYKPFFTTPKKEKLVVFNQRFSWERLPLIEIELAHRLKLTGYEIWHLYAPVYGRISLCSQLNQLKIIGERVGINFIGNLTKDEYHKRLALAETVITTSICDNLPTAMIEAVYMGAVPIAPNAMCFPEFIHKDNLYRPYDLDDIMRIVIEGSKRKHNIAQYNKVKVIKKYLTAME